MGRLQGPDASLELADWQKAGAPFLVLGLLIGLPGAVMTLQQPAEDEAWTVQPWAVGAYLLGTGVALAAFGLLACAAVYHHEKGGPLLPPASCCARNRYRRVHAMAGGNNPRKTYQVDMQVDSAYWPDEHEVASVAESMGVPEALLEQGRRRSSTVSSVLGAAAFTAASVVPSGLEPFSSSSHAQLHPAPSDDADDDSGGGGSGGGGGDAMLEHVTAVRPNVLRLQTWHVREDSWHQSGMDG